MYTFLRAETQEFTHFKVKLVVKKKKYAKGGIRTHEYLRNWILSPAPLARLGYLRSTYYSPVMGFNVLGLTSGFSVFVHAGCLGILTRKKEE